MTPTSDTRIPVTIIGGFLGAGKTTLLNQVLSTDHGQRVAVLVNDFGSINIDSELIQNSDGQVMNLANGCICCNISSDLMGQLDSLIDGPHAPQHLLIEASGVSDPGRIARILGYRIFRDRVQQPTVFTLLDAANAEHLDVEFHTLVNTQVAMADLVILNKTDLCTPAQLAAVKHRWLPPGTHCLETCFARVPVALVLGARTPAATASCNNHADHGEHFQTLSWKSEATLSLARLQQMAEALPDTVYRAKGLFRTGQHPTQTVLLQRVGARAEWSLLPSPPPSESVLVIIGGRRVLASGQLDSIIQRGLGAA